MPHNTLHDPPAVNTTASNSTQIEPVHTATADVPEGVGDETSGAGNNAHIPLMRWFRNRMKPVQQPRADTRLSSRRARITWTLGNLLLFAGAYLLLYVGGVYAQIEYNRQAARGDTDLPLMTEPANTHAPAPSTESVAFNAPVLNTRGQVSSRVPDAEQTTHISTISRLVIPTVAIDYKVVEVGWTIQEQANGSVAIWDVAEYAVGHHKGSANPGEDNNIVMAGHVGGYGQVFRDLFYVHPGDPVTIYSDGQQYRYVVQERLVLDEEHAPPEQRAANARYMEPTEEELVTLITCWPATGPNKFAQRIIVRATPYGADLADSLHQEESAWTIR
jgi:LPXTG-site transpeptidase (sortase) family protein